VVSTSLDLYIPQSPLRLEEACVGQVSTPGVRNAQHSQGEPVRALSPARGSFVRLNFAPSCHVSGRTACRSHRKYGEDVVSCSIKHLRPLRGSLIVEDQTAANFWSWNRQYARRTTEAECSLYPCLFRTTLKLYGRHMAYRQLRKRLGCC
jgi:hypothetical protein